MNAGPHDPNAPAAQGAGATAGPTAAPMALLGRALVWLAHGVVLATLAIAALGGWAYWGYFQMNCHPMFAAPEAGCGALQGLAAEHSLGLVRAIVPYRAALEANQQALAIGAAGLLGTALVIEIAALLLRRRKRGA